MTIPNLISAFNAYASQNPPLTGDDAIACLSSFIGGYRQRTLSPSIEVLPTSSPAWKAGFALAASHMDLAEMPGVLHELCRDHLPGLYTKHRFESNSIYNKLPVLNSKITIFLGGNAIIPSSNLIAISHDFRLRFPSYNVHFYLTSQGLNYEIVQVDQRIGRPPA